MKKIFIEAHKMTREMVKEYGVDYQAQFSLNLSYLLEERGMEMVELKGTKKQVKWAEDIRKEMIASIERELDVVKSLMSSLADEKDIKENKEEIEELQSAIKEIKKIEDAKFFIDNRHDKGSKLVHLFKNMKKAEKTLEKMKNLKLIELQGSEKQVAWAEKIRDEKLKRLAEIEDWRWNEYYYNHDKEKVIEVVATKIASAKTFIDTRDSLGSLVEKAINIIK